MSLMEMVVVVAVTALLVGISIPAVRSLRGSFESQGGTRAMINAALTTARAIAAKEQRYAGVRFQLAYNSQGSLKASQYMIFIHKESNPKYDSLSDEFHAVDGIEPLKLPDSLLVMDLRYRTKSEIYPGSEVIKGDDNIDETKELIDTTSFSIIFSPSGRIVNHDVRVRNRDGEGDYPSYDNESRDEIFNKMAKVVAGIAMFYQDDYAGYGLGKEKSCNNFVICDRLKFQQSYERGKAYSEYLKDLEDSKVYLNPHTGSMIKN